MPLAARASRSNALRRPTRAPIAGAFGARARATVALALAATLRAAPCAAEPAAGELRHDLRVDIPVTAGAAGVAIGLNLAAGSLTHTCRWCASNGLDDSVRAAWARADPAPARALSDGFAVGAPVLTLGLGALAAADADRAGDIPLNSLLVAEATSVAMALNAIAKVAFARERPYAHALSADAKATSPSADYNVSFFSGHTAFTFALATSAGTIASMRGYRAAPAVWAVGLPLAAATGYLRVAADRHYFTDVVGGMLVGALVGVGIPLLFHRPMSERVVLGSAAVPGGQVFSLTLPSPL